MVAIITSVIKEKRGTNVENICIKYAIVTMILFLSGCGYKAPPYYEKPTSANGFVRCVMMLVIIGSGVAGLYTLLSLCRQNLKVLGHQ
jgi:hypothetical protein